MTSSDPSKAPLVVVEGLAKSYPWGRDRLDVLRDLDLEVRRGEMLAVLGESGIGKTTLLNLLGLMDRPDRGRIRFDGDRVENLVEPHRSRFRNRRCGFVFQAHHLLPEFSAEENAAMPLWIRGTPPAPARQRARALLEELGLGDRLAHRPPQLSGGERQRVALARAFTGDPDLILADEPTGNLDPSTAERVFRLFRSVHARRGVTTILVTHNAEMASRCDRILRLKEGRLVPAADAEAP